MQNFYQGLTELLQTIDPEADRPGMIETPKRVVNAWLELNEGYSINPDDLVKLFDNKEDNVDYDEIVSLVNIPFSSTCEHHLMPFIGKAHIAYLPDKYVLGASKLARLLDVFARRFQIQERITTQLANFLYTCKLKPRGVMVILEAEHTCISCRGVRKPGAKMVTSAVRGVFKESAKSRSEFLELIKICGR